MSFLVSPGVEVNEIDLTNVIPAVSTSIGGYVGEFPWGPVGEAITVSSEKELSSYFGIPRNDVHYRSSLTAASFLKYGTALKVSRAIAPDANNASNLSSAEPGNLDIIRIRNEDDFLATTNFSGANFAARYPGSIGSSLAVIIIDYFSYDKDIESTGIVGKIAKTFPSKPNTSSYYTKFKGTTTGRDEIHIAVIDRDGLFTGTKNTILEVWEGLSLFKDAKKEDGSSVYYKEVINKNSSYIWAISLSSIYPYADVLVKDSATIARNNPTVIVPAVFALGDGGNFSLRANEAYYNIINYGNNHILRTNTVVGAAAGVTVTPSTITSSGGRYSFKFTITITYTAAGVWPTYAVFKAAMLSQRDYFDFIEKYPWIPENGNVVDWYGELYRNSDIPFTGGFAPVTSTMDEAIEIDFPDNYPQYLDGTQNANYNEASDVFEDAETIDVNFLFTGSVGETQLSPAESRLIEIARKRKDCIAFISAPLSVATATDDNTKKNKVTAKFGHSSTVRTSYAIFDSSPLEVYNKYTDKYVFIPASGQIAGLCANTDDVADPWFSPAGYNRGQLLGVNKLGFNPNKTHRDELYKAGVNPIVAFPGQGILLFGDKTAQAKPSAFDRINVRRLFITLEKAISTAAKYQLFEINDEFTRSGFRNMVESFLREVKGRKGVTDFLVVCDETNNTGEVIDTNRFVADIYIKPARSINFITLNFIATRTGVAFSEIVGK